MLNLCTIFTQHRYKISRSQRHQLRIIISIFSAEFNNQDFPPPPIGLLLPPWSWWQRLASRFSHLQLLPRVGLVGESLQINLTLGKDPPILGAETLQRLTAVKYHNKWIEGMHKILWVGQKAAATKPVKTERGTGSAVDSPCVHWTYPPGRSSPATKSPWNRDHWTVFGHLREQAIKLAVHISNDERVLWEALVLAQALWQGESATLAQPLRKELGITSQPKQKLVTSRLYMTSKSKENLGERSLAVTLTLSLTVALA